ncbi:glycosyltransferase family 4 protein [Grimontia sp. S25]|uniref:Glycosyltransferase family 4 protein n=1 Tax=Grimontia sedimenti TaxID=2711294 RepID=A0A6M1R8K1_9GAMM|nr:glycosyltransferase family 4 protein [Grimontia sedimenti]NGN98463.1 glycosyltransferase family 4 protein [Grimontia sedimenti]
MKLLLLSFYYRPDLCAGSFRTTALVESLIDNEDLEIELITTYPNRYASFELDEQVSLHEVNKRLTVHRIELPSHKSGFIDQAKAFLVFYHRVMKIVSKNRYDIVFSTSSRLFTAFLGARISNKYRIPLYLDIRDLFIDTINDVFPKAINLLISPILKRIERYTFSSASHINLVSEGFRKYFSSYPNAEYTFFTNGIDDEFLQSSYNFDQYDIHSEKPIEILYAGNIGEGQGLHTIIPDLAKRLGDKYRITIVGDGGRKPLLEASVKEHSNVIILPPVKRDKLIEYYSNSDVLFLHLNDYDAFKKVLPSKIFEYAASGKPMLAGVGGYAAEFIQSEVVNAAVFPPSNASQAEKALRALKLGVATDRHSFKHKYRRENIMNRMAASILELPFKS